MQYNSALQHDFKFPPKDPKLDMVEPWNQRLWNAVWGWIILVGWNIIYMNLIFHIGYIQMLLQDFRIENIQKVLFELLLLSNLRKTYFWYYKDLLKLSHTVCNHRGITSYINNITSISLVIIHCLGSIIRLRLC